MTGQHNPLRLRWVEGVCGFTWEPSPVLLAERGWGLFRATAVTRGWIPGRSRGRIFFSRVTFLCWHLIWWNLCTLYLCTPLKVHPLAEFMYLVFMYSTKGTPFGGIYVPCIYSHARWSYRRPFSGLCCCVLCRTTSSTNNNCNNQEIPINAHVHLNQPLSTPECPRPSSSVQPQTASWKCSATSWGPHSDPLLLLPSLPQTGRSPGETLSPWHPPAPE